MNNNWKEERYKEKEAKAKKNSNMFLYTFLIIAISGYIVFFTSNLWLPTTYDGVTVTAIGSTTDENERLITIDSWKYSEEQEKMEIIIEIENLSIEDSKYEWTLKNRSGIIKSQVVASDDGFFVLQADVKKKWTEVALILDFNKKDIERVTFYMDRKTVQAAAINEKLSLREYKKIAFKDKISSWEALIKEEEKNIEKLEGKVGASNKKMKELEESKKQKTTKEKEKISATIEKLEGDKANMEDKIKEKKVTIKELNDKIQYQKEILQEL